ncbi:hypothetical protein J5226_01700 [Lysobacter sp. K5869]|uniref:hypothetical protein n=1 Tax=Lysobacter sp. K5869 TaxID=2820808 RepID=UPI001C0646A5|nr:hypothetical protein [Lysobacter sp. K5869]QWP77146.1 hypothetical protein J5226_01700 [Lysobacter sp. K5869]
MTTMAQALKTIHAAQRALNEAAAEQWDADDAADEAFAYPDHRSRLAAVDLGGALAVDYHGDDHDSWAIASAALARPEVAAHIVQLRIAGPDEGANGLKTWDFRELIAAAPRFGKLTDLQIAASDPGDHNQATVEDDHLPALLALMPALRKLVLPQAPESGFFDLDLPDLASVRTGGDFRTRGFIGRLARAERLPSLRFVDFTDSLAPFLSLEAQPEDWSSTPFEDYERLFRSPTMERCWGFRLRNAMLTEAQYQALQALRPKCQFSVVLAAPHCYVSHWNRSNFPHRHLLPFG